MVSSHAQHVSQELVIHEGGVCVYRCDHRPVIAQQVDVCRLWLARFAMPRKTINTHWHSGFLKELAQQWSETLGKHWEQADRYGRRFDGARLYVSNGAFVVAALDQGYRVRQVPGRPEVLVAMATKLRE